MMSELRIFEKVAGDFLISDFYLRMRKGKDSHGMFNFHSCVLKRKIGDAEDESDLFNINNSFY